MVMTLEKLMKSVKEGVDKVDVTLEYGPDKNKAKGTMELGVRFRICSPGKVGADCTYSSLHFHYALQQSSLKDASPVVTAHFKEGQAKTALQGPDLPVYDAYALYLLMEGIQPEKPGWKSFTFRVTKKKIDGLIKSGEIRKLKMVFMSKVFDLAFWDGDAWNTFQDWITSS